MTRVVLGGNLAQTKMSSIFPKYIISTINLFDVSAGSSTRISLIVKWQLGAISFWNAIKNSNLTFSYLLWNFKFLKKKQTITVQQQQPRQL